MARKLRLLTIQEMRSAQSRDAEEPSMNELIKLREENTRLIVKRYIDQIGYFPTESLLYETMTADRIPITQGEVQRWRAHYSKMEAKR